MTTSPLADVELHLVESVADAVALKTWLGQRREGPLGLDVETSGLSAYRETLRTIQVGDRHHGWVIPWQQWGGIALEIFRAYDGEWAVHNTPFEGQFIPEHTGYELPWERVHDTMSMAALDDPVRSKALKSLTKKLIDPHADEGQKELKEAFEANGWSWGTIPIDHPAYWIYSAMDPVDTVHVAAHLLPRIQASCPEAYSLERSANRLCTQMMRKGMLLDVPYAEKSIAEFDTKADQIRDWLRDAHQITSPKSSRQIATAMEKLGQEIQFFTDRNAPQFDKDALAFYEKSGENAGVRQLTQYIRAVRHIEDIRDRYSRRFLEMRDTNDTVHCEIRVMGARTGRMSVAGPPLQQLPRDDKVIRGSFIPRPGHVFISCDLSQVEARLAAHFSQDPGLIQAFYDADNGGVDFFCGVASEIFAEPISKDDHRRNLTKSTVYGSLYSAGVDTMARTAGIRPDQMAPVKAGFDRRFPGLKQFSDRVVKESLSNSPASVRGPLGRLLVFDKGREHTQALNGLIQSHAAEYMKQRLVIIDAAGLGDAMRLVVHDEVILEVPAADAADALRTVTEAMTDLNTYRVPLTAEGKIMPERWQK